ncbi:uncharacterized protein BT62DRAFT_1010081 [Guyanagaster necrorhizus]|uniref:Uncharacterized protein n=1 Tax=Guyanagaster necrorhizus TaxID=856835 RepID=A0A9P7VLH3_9AGAR|nr:uncharacterized protein BT62DRAFT_1010081 [Guyanagaster necrorhizus MCA 3950]KAG7442748.1 hypothetical protein BT62DRAFT_1010081 [Guyanagaster necrorhizus MCA 3950]
MSMMMISFLEGTDLACVRIHTPCQHIRRRRYIHINLTPTPFLNQIAMALKAAGLLLLPQSHRDVNPAIRTRHKGSVILLPQHGHVDQARSSRYERSRSTANPKHKDSRSFKVHILRPEPLMSEPIGHGINGARRHDKVHFNTFRERGCISSYALYTDAMTFVDQTEALLRYQYSVLSIGGGIERPTCPQYLRQLTISSTSTASGTAISIDHDQSGAKLNKREMFPQIWLAKVKRGLLRKYEDDTHIYQEDMDTM